jgi:hypothetical protein
VRAAVWRGYNDVVMPDITKLPPIVHYAIAGVSATGGLLATQSLISNRTEKLVTGFAVIWLPIGYLLLVAVWKLAHARVTAARIAAGLPAQAQTPPA